MAQSLSKILLHLIFSTKNRTDIIPPEIMNDLHAYLAGCCSKLGSDAYRVGGTSHHIHIACTLPRTTTVSKLLEEIKKSSSAWIKTQDIRCKRFSWQAGYGAFSCGQSQLNALIKYIDRQQEHHRKKTFEEELIEILTSYQVSYDRQYLWS